MPDKVSFSAVILASGKSSRMKTFKSELPFDDNQNFFQKITGEYLNSGCKDVIVVMSAESYASLKEKISIPERVKIVINKYPEKGRFYSLKTGISGTEDVDFCFVQNIDNPFIDSRLTSFLLKNSHKADYIIPSYEGKGGHPGLISRKIIEAVKKTRENYLNMKDFLNRFGKFYAEYDDERIRANINTVSDYFYYFEKNKLNL